jgi:hypothetical protein
MKITCIENHYSQSSWANIVKGFTYDFVEMKIEHNVFYVTIKNENRILDFPAKHFIEKDFIRDYVLDKLLDNQ